MIGLALWIAVAAHVDANDADRAAAAVTALGAHVVDAADGVVVVDRVPFDVGSVAAENFRETLMGAYEEFGVVGGVDVLGVDGVNVFGIDVDPKPTGRKLLRAPRDKKATTSRLPFGGALLGKRIALSAGHGWLDDDGNGTFNTQRSNFQFSPSARGITEDFFTSETVTNQIIPLLLGMGADVVVVRAPDHDEGAEVVVDGVVDDGVFVGVTGGRQADAEGAGRVVFDVSQSPRQVRRLGIRFPAVANGAAAVVVEVRGANGSSFVFNLDQRRGPGSWQELGFFALDEDSSVVVSAGPGQGFLAVDRVMVGGGTHESGHPWWQMAAHSYVPERGAFVPGAVAGKNDVTIRPSYAELFDVDAFLSIHANASGAGSAGSTANGLSIYRYSCQQFSDHSSSTAATTCDDPPGSRDLLDEIHAATMNELNTEWDPNFNDRGRLVANFGELRDLIDTPGVLIETAFFDNLAAPSDRRASDNKALHDPRWREAFATGVVAGLARFFDATSQAPPARPNGLFAKNVDGGIELSWNAVERAAGYKVYRSYVDVDGGGDGVRAFDEGVVVDDGARVFFSDLAAGDVVAFKVAALDDNGEGYASSVVAAKVGAVAGVIVDAYDRRDAFVQDVDNSLSYSFEHAAALDGAVAGFDGADDDAVTDLAGYGFVDFFCGKDSTEHEPISAAQQAMLRAYVDGGGRLFVSGEEVGYALVETSDDAADQAFFEDVLGAVYVDDDADTYDVVIDGVDAGLDDGSGGVYEVVFPDVVSAKDGAAVFGTWPDGSVAATHQGNVIFLATPFEALVPAATRATVMQHVVDALAVPVPAEGEGEGEGEEGEGEGEGGEGEEGEGDEGEGEEGEGEGNVFAASVKDGGAEDGCGGCASSASSASNASLASSLLLLALRRRRR